MFHLIFNFCFILTIFKSLNRHFSFKSSSFYVPCPYEMAYIYENVSKFHVKCKKINIFLNKNSAKVFGAVSIRVARNRSFKTLSDQDAHFIGAFNGLLTHLINA